MTAPTRMNKWLTLTRYLQVMCVSGSRHWNWGLRYYCLLCIIHTYVLALPTGNTAASSQVQYVIFFHLWLLHHCDCDDIFEIGCYILPVNTVTCICPASPSMLSGNSTRCWNKCHPYRFMLQWKWNWFSKLQIFFLLFLYSTVSPLFHLSSSLL